MNLSTVPKKFKMDTRQMALIGLFSAIICIFGPLSFPLPISPVPITLGTFAIYFTIYVLGQKQSTISVLIYLLIGLVGLPVFSSFGSGPAKLLGPTGGYLIGYLFMTVISGMIIDKWGQNVAISFLGLLLGTIVLYLFGTIWLSFQSGLSFTAALAAGVIPYIPGDLVKIFLALFSGYKIRKRLEKIQHPL
ncbi:biotin transporter BioY [Lachnospiraceae bacterium OttesenSCG-928-D06]|nr:biotin transporter BioY [Lachnospiraceae bacterium OttesenSCG-928-D06]